MSRLLVLSAPESRYDLYFEVLPRRKLFPDRPNVINYSNLQFPKELFTSNLKTNLVNIYVLIV